MRNFKPLKGEDDWILAGELHVIGTPKAQPRVKGCIRGQHAAIYTPGTANGWKDTIRLAAASLAGRELTSPIYLQAKIILPRPKARRKDYYVVTKPDIDNLLKAIMDVLSQVRVWHDDAQVVRLEAEKIYQAENLACGAEIEIYEGVEDE